MFILKQMHTLLTYKNDRCLLQNDDDSTKNISYMHELCYEGGDRILNWRLNPLHIVAIPQKSKHTMKYHGHAQ